MGSSDGSVGQPDGLFDSGNIDQQKRFSVTFSDPGEFAYYCVPHPWMKGTVLVEPA